MLLAPCKQVLLSLVVRKYRFTRSRLHLNTVKADIQNGFNQIDRHHILSELFKHPSLSSIWRLVHWAYSSASPLLCYDGPQLYSILSSKQGIKQGDVLSSLLFSLGIKPIFTEAANSIDGVTQTYLDDLGSVCTKDNAAKLIHALRRTLPKAGLSLNDSTTILWPAPSSPPQDLIDTCNRLNIRLVTGATEFLGSFLGLDRKLISDNLLQKAQENSQLCSALLHPKIKIQSALIILRQCVIPSMNFITRTHPPSLSHLATNSFDRLILTTAKSKLGLPPLDEALILQLHLPLKQRGFGLLLSSISAPAAYLSSVATASPTICKTLNRGSEGIHPSSPNRRTDSSRKETREQQIFTPCLPHRQQHHLSSLSSLSPFSTLSSQLQQRLLIPSSSARQIRQGTTETLHVSTSSTRFSPSCFPPQTQH